MHEATFQEAETLKVSIGCENDFCGMDLALMRFCDPRLVSFLQFNNRGDLKDLDFLFLQTFCDFLDC